MDRDVRADIERCVLKAMAAADGVPMRWGVDDCALWAAGVVRDALGYDPVEGWRGRYDSRETAKALLGPSGLSFAFRAASRRHGWKPIDPADARPGDPGLQLLNVSSSERAVTTLICRAPGWFVARNEIGFTMLRAVHIRLAWSLI